MLDSRTSFYEDLEFNLLDIYNSNHIYDLSEDDFYLNSELIQIDEQEVDKFSKKILNPSISDFEINSAISELESTSWKTPFGIPRLNSYLFPIPDEYKPKYPIIKYNNKLNNPLKKFFEPERRLISQKIKFIK